MGDLVVRLFVIAFVFNIALPFWDIYSPWGAMVVLTWGAWWYQEVARAQ